MEGSGSMTVDIEALRALIEAATPSPWRWEINRKSRNVEICGGPAKGGFGRYDLTVLSFVRWGLNSAAPQFWHWNSEGGWTGKPQRADELAVAVDGRKHHADWFADIDHPDAQLIVAAVNALPDLLTEVAVLREALKPFADTNVLEPNGVIVGLERMHFTRARAALGNPS
jgi:hypothetical protein